MHELTFRKIGLPITALLLAALGGWLVAISPNWLIVFPIIIAAILILQRPFWGLLLFVMLIPLESAFLSLGGGAASVTRLLGIFVFGAWLLGELYNHRTIKIPGEIKLAIVFALYGIASILWAYSQSATASRILTAVQLVILALLIVNMVKDQEKLKKILTALFIGCLIVTFLGVIGIGVEKEGYLLTLQNQGAKEYGSYVGIIFLIGSILFIFGENPYRWLGLAAMAFATIPLIQVNERGIFLAIGLAWVAISVLTRQKAKVILFIAMILLVMSMLPSFLEQQGMISSYNAERLTIQNIFETGGTGRSEIWGAGLKMFTNNPIIGTGWGNFSIVYDRYASPAEIFDSNFSTSGKDAHSDLFGVAGELGIIGVILFLTLYGTILIRDVTALGRLSSTSRVYLILVIALMVYIFSAGLTSTFLWRKVYWLILGMGILVPNVLIINEHKNVLQGIHSSPPN